MSLKNFSKVKITQNDKSVWKLYKIDGTEVSSFYEWCLFIQDKFSYTTRDKYSQVVSKFLDFLVEFKIFEQSVTKLEFKNAIDSYKHLLTYGKDSSHKNLKEIAYSLNFNKIKRTSWSNNIAAINSFLNYVFDKEADEREYLAIKRNIIIPEEYQSVLKELNRTIILNNKEKESIKQKSFLANLCRSVGQISINRSISANNNRSNDSDFKNLDFPSIEISNLLLNTTSYRDRAIYSLLAGTGIRSSEAISLTWDMIDIPNQKVYITNQFNNDNESIKFKGRNTTETYFIPELKHIFFQALYQYQLLEAKSVNHNFVFQFLKGENYGEPYYKVSRQGFIKEFKKTVKRANIKPPFFNKNHFWTPHSLRHFYGVYMLNYIPLENKFGFSIEEVQKMMGHKSVIITQKYARKSSEYIKAQLEYAEKSIDGEKMTLKDFNNLLFNNFNKNNLIGVIDDKSN